MKTLAELLDISEERVNELSEIVMELMKKDDDVATVNRAIFNDSRMTDDEKIMCLMGAGVQIFAQTKNMLPLSE